ncbi:MAG: hypothetical protein DSY32_02555 [Aquifex sp.]|nr:MAG: hypothetical protein DSY32_02555 [Aquifex sp.]
MPVVAEAKVYGQDILREKSIFDKFTGNPPLEIRVEDDYIVVEKEKGEERIPVNSLRGKAIIMRLETGISEFTEPIYV